MNVTRLGAMARKELVQVLRDPRSLMIALLMPLVQMLLLGYGVSLDIKHVPLCTWDREASQRSEALLMGFASTQYFQIVKVVADYPSLTHAMIMVLAALPLSFPRISRCVSMIAAQVRSKLSLTPPTTILPALPLAMPRPSSQLILRKSNSTHQASKAARPTLRPWPCNRESGSMKTSTARISLSQV